MNFADEEIARIEKATAKKIIAIKGLKVDAEDINGVTVKAYLYEGHLFDMDCNPLHGYEVKKDWAWVLFVSACISFYLFYLLITGGKS